MRIPRHWARASVTLELRGDTFSTEAFGHSDRSPADAERDARERAMRVARWYEQLEEGDDPPPPDQYGYGGDRPMREPIVRELGSGSERFAAITRNNYGALVLNTAAVGFIDVDVEPPPGLGGRLWNRLRGVRVPTYEETLVRVRAAADASRLGMRIYRTAAGIRCLVASELLDPTDRRTEGLFVQFGADPRYRVLCKVQRCFRARLTPKPWRCGLPAPVWPWPFRSAAHEEHHRAWLRRYEEAIQGYATCELIESRGPEFRHPLAAEIVREHDAACLRPGRPLA